MDFDIGELASSAWGAVSQAAEDVYDTVSEAAEDVYNTAETPEDVYDIVSGAAEDVYDTVSGAAEDVYDTVSEAEEDVDDTVSEATSEVTSEVLGATAAVANACEDWASNAEELFQENYKLLVGASILCIKNEMSKKYDDVSNIFTNTLTTFNNEITALNKSAVVITDMAAVKMFSVTENIKNIWNDGFMPAELPGELAGTKMLDNPLLKGIGEVGGKIGVVATVLNPIMEYNNSLEPYKDDIDAAYEIDPENAGKYDFAMHVEAGLDAASFGYVRGVLNTVPSVANLISDEDPEWADGWINNVNYAINSRNLMNEMDKAFKDPVKGPIIQQFLR